MHNPPAFREAHEDEREKAVRRLAVRHGEFPFAVDHGGAAAEQVDVEILKFKVAHFLAGRLVTQLIARKRWLPSLGDCRAGKEGKVRRSPVAFHEVFEIAMVPGFHLGYQHVPDGLDELLTHLRR